MDQEPIVVKLLTQSKAIQYVFLAISIILVVAFSVWIVKKNFKKGDVKDLKSLYKENSQTEKSSKSLFMSNV